MRLATHLARAADDIGDAFAAALAALEANEAFKQAEEAVPAGTTTTQPLSVRALLLALSLNLLDSGLDLHLGYSSGLHLLNGLLCVVHGEVRRA